MPCHLAGSVALCAPPATHEVRSCEVRVGLYTQRLGLICEDVLVSCTGAPADQNTAVSETHVLCP